MEDLAPKIPITRIRSMLRSKREGQWPLQETDSAEHDVVGLDPPKAATADLPSKRKAPAHVVADSTLKRPSSGSKRKDALPNQNLTEIFKAQRTGFILDEEWFA